ncbi:MAG: hypothetical protein JNL58_23925 [Planctomyces sp.]|nr:hypothetical protein [Planctomyces sp.]
MGIPATSTLMKKYLDNKAKIKAIEGESKPLRDENKMIEEEVLTRLQGEGKNLFQKGKMVATVEQQANSVPWAKEFLKAMGPEAVEAAKEAAGTKTVVNIALLD